MHDDLAMRATAQLSREVGRMAGRLAALLGADAVDSRLRQAQEFLTVVSASAAVMPEAASPSAPTPLERLRAGFALTAEEVDVLLLGGMPEEHEGHAAVMRALHPRGEPRMSVGLAAQLVDAGEPRAAFRSRLESGPLLGYGLVRLRGDAPFYELSLEPAEGLWAVLHGGGVWPAQLRYSHLEPVRAGLDEWFADPLVEGAIRAVREGAACTVLVTADSEEIAFARGMALAAESGVAAAGFRVPVAADPDLEKLAAAHSLARGLMPIVQMAQPEGPAPAQTPGFAGYPGPVMICGRSGAIAPRGDRPILVAPVERLGSAAHRRMWQSLAPELNGDAPALAARYPIEPAYAAEAVRDVRATGSRVVSAQRIGRAIQARSGLSLSGGVQLVRPAATMPDLVLHPDRAAQIREALDRLLHQPRVLDEWGFLRGRRGSRGVRMLFAGPPGTGKTLSAEVMASELSMDLLIVDISRVVSKWIGETEKNLAAVFDTAERTRAVLFFDEADALFGKRTEVSDAHDRYANLETAYLLARLERFEGLAILATNLRHNIDPAFVRRLEFSVNFDEPGREERVALWNLHLPRSAPIASDVNIRELANLFPVAGALIRNASVAAGFLAAADGGTIRRSHLIHALRREYDKAGKAFPGIPESASTRNGRAEIKEQLWQ